MHPTGILPPPHKTLLQNGKHKFRNHKEEYFPNIEIESLKKIKFLYLTTQKTLYETTKPKETFFKELVFLWRATIGRVAIRHAKKPNKRAFFSTFPKDTRFASAFPH